MPNFNISAKNGANMVLKEYCKSTKELKSFRQWSAYADKNKTALITTIWYQENKKHDLFSLISHGDKLLYRVPKIYTFDNNPEGKNHSNRFTYACEKNIPIYGILKSRENNKLSSDRVYKLIQARGENFDNQPERSFLLEDVTCFKNELIDNPENFKSYVEMRSREQYVIEAIEYKHVHSEILNNLRESLKINLTPEERIKTEYRICEEQADLVVLKNDNVTSIYEVKTQETMEKNIRAALGQLISYSRILENSHKKIIVVSNAARTEAGEEFLKYVAGLFGSNITLEYICLN
jgi:hypothetical protein